MKGNKMYRKLLITILWFISIIAIVGLLFAISTIPLISIIIGGLVAVAFVGFFLFVLWKAIEQTLSEHDKKSVTR
jgi:membrane protein implicated in regulation of membrane protease activity